MVAKDYLITKVEAYDAFNTRYTCSASTSISKGMILMLTDPRTASKHTGGKATIYGKPTAGIAAMDKDGSDPSTTITVWTKGIFDAYASGAITAGDAVIGVADGQIATAAALATTVASGALIIGYALETAADQEQINFKLDL